VTNWKFWAKKKVVTEEPKPSHLRSLFEDEIEWRKIRKKLELEINRGAGIG
jgi:hypothetical protein